MARSLEEILRETPKDAEQIRDLIDRVLARERKEGEISALFLMADGEIGPIDEEKYRAKTIGEAISGIVDEYAYSRLHDNMESIEKHLGEFFDHDGNKYLLSFREWKREYIKRFSRELLKRSDTEKDLRAFLKIELRDYYRALDIPSYFDTVKEYGMFDGIREKLEEETLGQIIRENLSLVEEDWNLMCGALEHVWRCRGAIDRISVLIFEPLLDHYRKSEGAVQSTADGSEAVSSL